MIVFYSGAIPNSILWGEWLSVDEARQVAITLQLLLEELEGIDQALWQGPNRLADLWMPPDVQLPAHSSA